jgi:K(+)-stimulated pyrophosphate-energized sodium pump
VIAPILGDGHGSKEADKCHKSEMCMGQEDACNRNMPACHGDAKCHGEKAMKCDLNECSKMNKEECAKMCDQKGCSAEEKAICMSHYDANGKWIGKSAKKGACCDKH